MAASLRWLGRRPKDLGAETLGKEHADIAADQQVS